MVLNTPFDSYCSIIFNMVSLYIIKQRILGLFYKILEEDHIQKEELFV